MMQTVQPVQAQRFYVPKFPPPNFQKPAHNFQPHRQLQPTQAIEFDGKRLRKAVTRKTVDYNSSIVNCLESRVWQRDHRDRRAIQADPASYTELVPPLSMLDNPINAVTTKFVRTSTNKMRCPIFCVAWTPEGRRLVTGASSGEFTLWNGLTFNFETILQAHDSPVRCMVWSHNDIWMVTGDHSGYVKYWQSNMNNVKMFQAHKEAIRGISFCPLDNKFTTCSDDGTVRIWDFLKCFEEKILRGHGADVKCVDWHPQKALIVSGSKDSQQPIKLWDPRSGQSLATIHVHKNTVMDTKWNKNGNWLLTASRDHLIKLFDIRNMKEEMQTFRGHKKEATTLSWHPVHENLFCSGGSDGSVMFWVVGADKEVGAMEQAHDSCVWSLAWHPLGHILCSGSNDHTSKFWTRNRPGDRMRDKYNLNTLPKGQEEGAEYDDSGIACIPGMGLEHGLPEHLKVPESSQENEVTVIPGLDFTSDDLISEKPAVQKKIPFSKPIPKQFQQQWMESKQPLLLAPPEQNAEDESSQNNLKTEQPPPLMPPPLLPPPILAPLFPPPDPQKITFMPPPPPPSMPDPNMQLPPNAQMPVPIMDMSMSGPPAPPRMLVPDQSQSIQPVPENCNAPNQDNAFRNNFPPPERPLPMNASNGDQQNWRGFGYNEHMAREGPFRPEEQDGPFRSGAQEVPFRPDGREGPFRPDGREGPFRPDGREGSFRPDGREGPFRPDGREGSFRQDGREGPFGPEGREGSFRHEGREGPFRHEGRDSGREGSFRCDEGPYRPDGRERNMNDCPPDFRENMGGPMMDEFDDMRHMPNEPCFDDRDARFSENDIELRLQPPSHNHNGPDEMGFNTHKRSWQEGPGKDPHGPSGDRSRHDFRGPIPPGDYSRFPERSGGNRYFRGRSPRNAFRGRSPYHVVNQRNRGYD